MEELVLALLSATQLPQATPRKDAEYQLEQLHTNDQFPCALVSVASHSLVPTNNRQAALNYLKIFVQKSWSESRLGFEGRVLVNDATKEEIRRKVYAIVIDEDADTKVTAAASAVVSKIASVDYPDAWPDLLSNLLSQAPRSDDGQLHGILTVLVELLQDALDESAYAANAKDLLTCLHNIAVDEARKPTLRTLAVLVFRSCFDTIEMIKQEDKSTARQLTQDALDLWLPFLAAYLKLDMPATPSKADEDEGNGVATTWRGVIMLKIRVISALARIQNLFPSLLGSYAWDLFITCWEGLRAHAQTYRALYTEADDRQGKLTDSNNLQYTFDFLTLEELDYLHGLLSAPQVKKGLSSQLESLGDDNQYTEASWIVQVLSNLVDYACITAEDEVMWEMDINIFLVEETSATENYTHRAACTSFARRLCGWLPQQTLGSLLFCMKTVFNNGSSDWRVKESVLFLLQQVFEEIYYDPLVEVSNLDFANACLDVFRGVFADSNDLLRGRAHILAGTIITSAGEALLSTAIESAKHSLSASQSDSSDIVKLCCLRAMQDYVKTIPVPQVLEIQRETINAISSVLQSQDLNDLDNYEELTATLVETLRDAIIADAKSSLQHNALTVLFTIIQYSASSLLTSELAEEAFKGIVEAMADEGEAAYSELCTNVLPTLMGALDVAGMTSKDDLGLIAMTMLALLTEHTHHGLPEGFVSVVMPKICRILFTDTASELHEKATVIIQLMLSHDATQVFSWKDPQIEKGGLEMTLLIIERLLGPQVDDASAAEVGSLAVELVEKADPESLRPLMPSLLNVTAFRLTTATHEPLIQSLTLIFAHLAIVDAQQLLDFLSITQIQGHDQGSGLEAVMRKWLESSVYFVGAKNIRKNLLALANIYKIHDARLSNIYVQGDLIVENTSRIKTRSMAKKEPDQYQMITVQMKILKVLISEIPPDPSPVSGSLKHTKFRHSYKGQENDSDEEDGDDDWEDDNDFLDLASASAREELMNGSITHFSRDYNKDTQDLLLEFFHFIAQQPEFQAQYPLLTEPERQKLEGLERVSQVMDRFQLSSVHST